MVVQGLEIPHLYAHVKSLRQENIPERKKLTLDLFLLRDSEVMKEMEARVEVHDSKVEEFYKSNKRLFEKTQPKTLSITKWLSQLSTT